MKHIINYLNIKYLFSVQFLVIVTVSVLINQNANAVVQQVDLDETIYQDQVNDFRSQEQWCSPFWWAKLFLPPYPSPSQLVLSAAANEEAQIISDFMATDEGSNYTGNAQLDILQILPTDQEQYSASSSTVFSSQNQTFAGALIEWGGNSLLCDAIMSLGFVEAKGKIGFGKAIGNSGLPYWTMIVFEEAPLTGGTFNPGLTHSLPPFSPRSTHIAKLFAYEIPKPDLMVTSFNTIGKVKKIHDHHYQVAVRVVVENNGTEKSGAFRIGASTANGSSIELVPFTVVGQNNIWKPLSGARLYPGEKVVFEGNVSFYPGIKTRKVWLNVTADDCSDSDSYCSVNESNEDNNQSNALSFINPFRAKQSIFKKSIKFNEKSVRIGLRDIK